MSSPQKIVFSDIAIWSKVFAAGLLLFVALHFYIVGHPLVLVFSIGSYLIYKYGPPENFDYFWADSEGINFFTSENEITHINWGMVEKMDFAEDIHERQNVYLKLSFKLEDSPKRLNTSGFKKTTIKIPSRRKKIFEVKRIKTKLCQ